MYKWQLDCEESWALKNWWFWTVVLEKILESPLDCKEIQPVHSKVDQSWVFIGRNDAKAETPILWPPHAKSWLIGKDSDAGRDWGQEEKGMTEDEMAGRHHWLDRHEFEWTLGVGDGQGGLACCDSQDRRVGHDWATELNRTELNILPILPLKLGLYFLLEWWILDLGFWKNVLSSNEFRDNFIREVPNWCFVFRLTRITLVGSFQFDRIKGTWLCHRHCTWRNLCFDWW